MKKQILAFERIEGRSLDARRMYNAHVQGLFGGKKIGEGLQKCVYDADEDVSCRSNRLPRLPSNELNVVLSKSAFEEEKHNKMRIARLLDPQIFDRIFLTLNDTPACTNLKLPAKCTSEAKKAMRIYLARIQKGSNSKVFASRKAFGLAVINLVFGLWAMHAHGLLHGDVKISPGAENAVRTMDHGHEVYKLIDLGMVTSFAHVKRGIEDRTSTEASELWAFRTYSFWSVGHLYALLHLQKVKQLCKHHNVPWERVLQIFIENIDIAGLLQSLKVLVNLNPTLKLKPLLASLYANPEDFSNKREQSARIIVAKCARSVIKIVDTERSSVHEMFQPLEVMYAKIRAFCDLSHLPENIHAFTRTSPSAWSKRSK